MQISETKTIVTFNERFILYEIKYEILYFYSIKKSKYQDESHHLQSYYFLIKL